MSAAIPLTIKEIAPKLASRVQKYLDEQHSSYSAHLYGNIPFFLQFVEMPLEEPKTALHKLIREERKAHKGFRNARNGLGVVAGVFSIVGSYAMGLSDLTPVIIGGILGSSAATTFHLAYLPRMRAHYATRLFHESLQAVATTKSEKVYVEILTDIAKLPQTERKKLLAPLNTLLDTHIQLAQWERELQDVQIEPETLRQEAINLVQKAKNTTDPTTRDAFLQSARLAEERLGVLPQIETMSHRLQSQQELIYQTLLSQQMALRRGKVAVQSVQFSETNRETTSLSDTATRLHQQSQAIEDALQELLTLR